MTKERRRHNAGPDEGQARSGDGRRQRSFDCLGHCQNAGREGAELAFTYQGDALGKRVKPLAASLGVDMVLPCDVENLASVDEVFAALREKWGQLDFLVHAIAFSDKNELRGAMPTPRARIFRAPC